MKHLSVFAKLHLSSPYRVVRDFLNVRVNQNSQVTDASVRKMESCAIVGDIALDHVITNEFLYDFKYFQKTLFFNMFFYLAF